MRSPTPMSDGPLVPVIDLGQPRHLLAAQIGAACEQVGFFQIVGHGVGDRTHTSSGSTGAASGA